MASAALELRLALVHERVDTLVLVLGGEQEIERAALELETRVERRVPGHVHRLSGDAGGDRRLRRDGLRELLGLVEPSGRRIDVHDEPDVLRLLRGDVSTREDELVR